VTSSAAEEAVCGGGCGGRGEGMGWDGMGGDVTCLEVLLVGGVLVDALQVVVAAHHLERHLHGEDGEGREGHVRQGVTLRVTERASERVTL